MHTTMKKFYTILMLALTATMLTSCDERWFNDIEDREEAYTLEGTWTGYIDTYFRDRFGMSGSSYRTTMYFERYNSYGGVGYEVDYNSMSPYDDYYYCEFDWEVVNGEIVIRYADSWNNVYIYDYRLTSSSFIGYMDDGTSRDIRFQLAYDNRFDWGYWRYSYAPATRSAANDSTAIATTTDNGRVKACGEFAKILK